MKDVTFLIYPLVMHRMNLTDIQSNAATNITFMIYTYLDNQNMEYRKCTSTMNETDPDLKTEMKVESVCQVKQRSIFKQQL